MCVKVASRHRDVADFFGCFSDRLVVCQEFHLKGIANENDPIPARTNTQTLTFPSTERNVFLSITITKGIPVGRLS